MHTSVAVWKVLALCLVALACALAGVAVTSVEGGSASGPLPEYAQISTRYPIKHVVIIDKENRSYDNLFGLFPGGDGTSYARLSDGKTVRLGRTPDSTLLDIGHAGAAARLAVNNGRMDRFD